MTEITKELLDVLACPIDHESLDYDKEKSTLTCKKCHKVYPITDGIPHLTP